MIDFYRNLGYTLFEQAIKAVYDESEPDGSEKVYIYPLDVRRAIYEIEAEDMYGIHQRGLITTYSDRITVETTAEPATGDPFIGTVLVPFYEVHYTYK